MKKTLLLTGILLLLPLHAGADPSPHEDAKNIGKSFGKAGKKTGKSSASSLERFARAASYEKNAKTADEAVQHAFAMLDDVAQGDHTQWSIVYDIKERRAYFRTRTARDVRWIDIDGMSLECSTPVRMLDINSPLSGDVGKSLVKYSADVNQKLVRSSFSKTPFLSETPPELRDELANYPSATSCRTGTNASGGK